MKNRVVICLLCIALTVNMLACGKSEAVETTAEVTEEEVEEPEEEEPEEPAEEPEPEETEEPEVSEPEPEEAEEPESEPEDLGYVVDAREPYTMYTNTNCNIRALPDASSDLIGTAAVNTGITVVGVTDTGWSQIEFNGVVCYIKSSLLSESEVAVASPEVPETPQAPQAQSSSGGSVNENIDIDALFGNPSSGIQTAGDLPTTGTTGSTTDGTYGTVQ